MPCNHAMQARHAGMPCALHVAAGPARGCSTPAHPASHLHNPSQGLASRCTPALRSPHTTPAVPCSTIQALRPDHNISPAGTLAVHGSLQAR
eukprot:220345-Chlamydomonas_euryale.AAC.3